jgi:carbon monoxide dehydrogenase subunit G
MIKAVINIEAPREQVFGILSDYPKYTEWVPGCEKATVTASNGAASDVEIVVNTMKRMTLGLRFESVPSTVLSFRMISGKDIKAYTGSYRLMDSADGTGSVVIAELDLDAGPMAPKFLVERIVKKTLDDTGNAIKKMVKSMPAPRPEARAAAAGAAAAKTRRVRHIVRVVKTADGSQVWFAGQTYRAAV